MSTEYLPRDRSVYVTSKTKRRLRWLCEHINATGVFSKDLATGKIEPMTTPKITQDHLAETLINDRIEYLYPNLPKLEKRMKALEDQLVSELANDQRVPTIETGKWPDPDFGGTQL